MALLTGRRVLWILAALAVGLAAGLLLLSRGGGEPLTSERLAEARARWAERGPATYVLDLEMRGSLEDRRRIEVRDGQVVLMTTSGVEVPRAAWSYWTVEGLFDFLHKELQNAARPGRAFGGDATRVVVLVRFDRRYGYPAFFYRHVMGSLADVEWRVELSVPDPSP